MLFRRRILRSNFRLLTGFSSFLSMALNRGNEAVFTCKFKSFRQPNISWETRIDPEMVTFEEMNKPVPDLGVIIRALSVVVSLESKRLLAP